MNEDNIRRMWAIDHKLQLGDKITAEEKDFFNANYDLMVEEMQSNLLHWEYHTSKIN